MNQERRRIEYLTELATSGFRGLPMMLFGLAMFIAMFLNYLSEIESQRNNHTGRDLTWTTLFALLCLAAFIIGYPKIRAHFADRFGQAFSKPKKFRLTASSLLMYMPLFYGHFFGNSIDADGKFPISIMFVGLALFVLLIWYRTYRGVDNALLYFSIVIFVSSVIDWGQIFGFADYSARAAFYRCVTSMLLGLVYFIMGTVDYRMVKSSMRPDTGSEGVI